MNGDAVTIKSIEVSIVDRAFDEGWVKPDRPQTRTGYKVAVVGSGPAGLACAAQLNRAGHLVTVFERADRIGGLLMYGIPNMKLDKGIVQRRVNLMADAGVRFITGTEVGKHIPVRRIQNDYDAVVLAIGATKARDLQVDGRSLHGIHLAMDFLSRNTKSLLDSGLVDGRYISAAGRDVVVIGGGDTGTDCVGTSLRHGARSVTQLEILPRPPDRRPADNPWPQWPKIFRTDYGQEEAAALQGKDPRIFGVSTKKFVGDAQGRVKELHTVQVEWVKGDDGRFGPREVPGSEKVIKADLVLLALGFTGPEKTGAVSELGVRLDERGNVWTDEEKQTSVPGIFAAGDASRGQSLVVWAIHEGRRAARGVDRFLMQGESYLPG
jgi:glutamate synthase (NADPH/NADH) small chain